MPVQFNAIFNKLKQLVTSQSGSWVANLANALLAQWSNLSGYFNSWNAIQNIGGTLLDYEIVERQTIGGASPVDVFFGYRNVPETCVDAIMNQIAELPTFSSGDFAFVFGVSSIRYSAGDTKILVYQLTGGRITKH